MSLQEIVNRLEDAVRQLSALLSQGRGPRKPDLVESDDQVSLQSYPVEPVWILESSSGFARSLLQAGFTVHLDLQAQGRRRRLEFSLAEDGELLVTFPSEDLRRPEADYADDDALAELAGNSWPFADFRRALEQTPGSTSVAPFSVQVSVWLNKVELHEKIAAACAPVSSQLFAFLFRSRLVRIFERSSLEDIEKLFFVPGRRTVFLVIDLEGGVDGEWMAVCGRDRLTELAGYLARPLPGELGASVREILEFRDWHCVWHSPTAWLVPGAFSTVSRLRPEDAESAALLAWLERFRLLLSILFLANRTRHLQGGTYEVRFSGQKEVTFKVSAAEIQPGSEGTGPLFSLYLFAYDGFSSDKIETVRQFLALSAEDLPSLLRKAGAVLGAAERAREQYLQKKVGEYFAARQKTQEYVESAVAEAEGAIVKMTQEVAENVYKTLGAVVLVVVAKAIDPKLQEPAALVAATALAVYLGIILFYFLPSVRDAWRVRKLRFEDHIESFRELLGEKDTQKLLDDRRILQAREDFHRRKRTAGTIYWCLFLAALAAVVYYFIHILV